jgi:hypothetical protein
VREDVAEGCTASRPSWTWDAASARRHRGGWRSERARPSCLACGWRCARAWPARREACRAADRHGHTMRRACAVGASRWPCWGRSRTQALNRSPSLDLDWTMVSIGKVNACGNGVSIQPNSHPFTNHHVYIFHYLFTIVNLQYQMGVCLQPREGWP